MAYRRKYTKRRAPARKRRSYSRTRYSRRPTRRATKKRVARKPKQISKFVLAQLDPFSDKVAGVKIPDANTQPSATSIVEDEWSLTTGATYGTQVMALRPFVTNMSVAGTTTSASAWGWPAAYGGVNSSKQGTITTNNILVRSCAYGARVSCALSPNNVTGYIHVCLSPTSDFGVATWTYPQTISDMQNSPFYKRFPLAMLCARPLKLVSKIIDENAFRYIQPFSDAAATSTDSGIQNEGFSAIIIAVTGVSLSTTAVSIESLLHLETIPNVSSSQGTSPAAMNDSRAQEAATNVATSTGAARFEGMLDSFGNLIQTTSGYASDLLGYGAAGARSVVEPVFGDFYAGAQGYAYGLGREIAGAGLASGLGYLGNRANRRIMY